MTEPTPPRAPDAVPEAVRERNRALLVAARDYFEGNTERSLHELREKQAAIDAAILTALREATESRDQEIARLTTELAAAQAEIKADEEVISDLEHAAQVVESGTLHEEIESLQNELAAAKVDTARLDWIERTSANLFSWRTERVTGPARFWYCNGYQGATPRAAIDAARAAEGEG